MLLGALVGFATAALVGWLLARGALKLNLQRFFAFTGAFLVIVAAGVLAYALYDLQEAGVVPGPFTALATLTADGTVGVGFDGFPFGWAFDVSATVAPGGTAAALLQALAGFMPQMSWVQVIAWAGYLAVVGTLFVRGLRHRKPAVKPQIAPAAAVTT